MICISLSKISQIEKLNKLNPPLVELRYDLLLKAPHVLMPTINSEIRQVSTCRPGPYNDNERIEILTESIELGAKYVDVEIESNNNLIQKIKASAEETDCQLIISYHNFKETPGVQFLEKQMELAFQAGADIVKMATQVNSIDDIQILLELYKKSGRKLILGMGEMGKILRIAALKFGSEFTFASLDTANVTAPGQLTYNEMKSIENLL